MAHGTLHLVNNLTGETKVAPTGYSWTTLFFGWIVPLIRMDWKNFGINIGICMVIGVLTAGFGAIVVPIVFSFIYNKMYIKDLLNSGWKIEMYQGSQSLEFVGHEIGYDLSRFMAV